MCSRSTLPGKLVQNISVNKQWIDLNNDSTVLLQSCFIDEIQMVSLMNFFNFNTVIFLFISVNLL